MNVIDKIVGYFDPHAGARRIRSRYAMQQMEKFRRYDAAGNGRRFDDWKAGTMSANRELEMSLSRIIARSRDLDRNNPYAKRAVERIADNVVGNGIRPTFDRSVVKLKKAWTAWAEGDGQYKAECDFDGRTNLYGIQWLAMRTIAESGSCIIRQRRTTKNKRSGIPIQIQIFEPDIIDFSRNHDALISKDNPGGFQIQGVEFTADGRRHGYWMFDRYPTEIGMHGLSREGLISKFVPADEILHVYQVERPGQCHGVPFGVQSFMRLKDFDDFEDAELIRQKIAACFGAFVTETIDSAPGVTSSKKPPLPEKMEPGIIERLSPGETVSFGNPPTKEGFESYSRSVLRGIAAGYGVTYEALTGDMSNVNFSSGRMGWLEFQRTVSRYQNIMFLPIFCGGVAEWFLEGAKIGMIYAKDDVGITWTPPRREMIDPQKEIAALNSTVRSGFMDWGEAVTELGYDPETILERIEKWNKLFDDKGIILDVDPRKVALGGKMQAPPPDPNAQDLTPAQANKK